MAPVYPKIDLDREKGSIFWMVFCYTKKHGTVVLTGGYLNICDYIKKNFGPCHGQMTCKDRDSFYPDKWHSSWDLFGTENLCLMHSNKYKLQRPSYLFDDRNRKIISQLPDEHKRFILYRMHNYQVLGTWRKLPKAYLKELEVTELQGIL